MREDLTHIYSKLNSLEDNHPAHEPLQDENNTVIKDQFEADDGLKTISYVNENLSEDFLVDMPEVVGGALTVAVGAPWQREP